jgi:hypothetical protein
MHFTMMNQFEPKLTTERRAEFNKPKEIRPPTYYTAHGGEPTNKKEWVAHNFRVGEHYAMHGVSEYELSTDWPEIFTNKDCMDGYRNAWGNWE